MSKRSQCLFPLVVSLVMLFCVPAFARHKSHGLSSPLGTIKWGDSRSDVVAKVKKQLLHKLLERDDLKGDPVRMQRAHKRVLSDVDRFKKSYEKLDKSSGYRVSVISDEFVKGNGEALMRIKDKVANRYYFFVDGGLYKMVVAYNQDYLSNVDFETFVVQAAKKYGKPADTDYGTVGGKDALVSATWSDGTTILQVRNKKEFFGTFTMSFADKSTAKRLEKVHEALRDNDSNKGGVSSRVKALTKQSKTDADKDVVDSIVGDSDINLNEGRPVDEQVRYGKDGKPKGEVASNEKSKKKKKHHKKHHRKHHKHHKKRDFSDIKASSSGGDDLIIY